MKDCDFTDEKPSKLMRVKPAGNQQLLLMEKLNCVVVSRLQTIFKE